VYAHANGYIFHYVSVLYTHVIMFVEVFVHVFYIEYTYNCCRKSTSYTDLLKHQLFFL